MKILQWQFRLLCCFLAFVFLLVGFLCCLPVRAGAIVPLGLVQSALASYVTSTGYKMYNDQGTGQDIIGSLSDLYQSWLDSPSGQALSVWTLTHIAAVEAVYADNSGNIVITKQAADIFQQFSDWIASEYSVPVGSSVPTEVLASAPGGYSNANGSWIVLSVGQTYSFDASPISNNNFVKLTFTVTSASQPVLFWHTVMSGFADSNGIWSAQSASAFTLRYTTTNSSGTSYNQTFNPNYYSSYQAYGLSSQGFNKYPSMPVAAIPVAPTYWSYFSDAVASGGVVGLAVSLAQSVVDRANQLDQDESLVVGVGADVGATAADIADLVAQGVKAQTLDPSVTVVADAVIDTPVQPYPDIDGLGLPTLGAALVSRFPFCVPWDFVDTLRILNATPTPPVFDVTLIPAAVAARWGVSGNYTLHVDLTSQEYAKLFVALRWGTLVGFCLGLALLTKRLIWTA